MSSARISAQISALGSSGSTRSWTDIERHVSSYNAWRKRIFTSNSIDNSNPPALLASLSKRISRGPACVLRLQSASHFPLYVDRCPIFDFVEPCFSSHPDPLSKRDGIGKVRRDGPGEGRDPSNWASRKSR